MIKMHAEVDENLKLFPGFIIVDYLISFNAQQRQKC